MQTRLLKLVLAGVLAVSFFGCNKSGGLMSSAPMLKTEQDKTLYALGLVVGRNLGTFNLNDQELAIVEEGIADQVAGKKPKVELQTYGPKINQIAMKRAGAKAEQAKTEGKAYADKMAKEKGAEKLPSGVIYIPEKEGAGASPKPTDVVKVDYVGTLTNGTEFDSSIKRGKPAQFPLNGVIPCWTEGLQKMKVGGKAKLVCPSETAYGEHGHPPTIPGGSTLTFEVTLLGIVNPAEEPSHAMPGHMMPPGHGMAPKLKLK